MQTTHDSIHVYMELVLNPSFVTNGYIETIE